MRTITAQNGTSGRLPIWTWILPFFVCILGAQLALLFDVMPAVALWYLTVPLAIVMIHWWGLGVLIGFYLGAAVNALLLGFRPEYPLPFFALPEIASILCSWLLFKKFFKGKCWLPDAPNTIAWFLLGVIVPLSVGVFSHVFLQTSLADVFTKAFLWKVWWEWISDVFCTLAISSPLLVFSTPFLEEKGVTQTEGAVRAVWIPVNRHRNIVTIELVVLFLGIALLSATMPFEKYWFLYAFFSLWSALRYGIAMATVANSLIVILALIIPISFSDFPDAVRTFEWGLVSVHPGMTLLYVISLITGRSYSDIMAEMRERISAEVAVMNEKMFTDAALDAQQDIFLVFEQASGRPIRWNAAFREITGLSDDEIRKTKIPDDWIDPGQLKRAKEKLDALEELKKGTIELTFISADGKHVPTEYVASLMTDDIVQNRCVIVIGRDISERKKIEQERKELELQLREALKMEAVGTLAGGIANDFNNILSTIIGFSELIFDEVKDNSQLRSHMEHVLAAGERAKLLVRQILAFSRQSEGSHTTFSPSATLRETVKMLRMTTPDNITMETNYDENADMIHADPTQFHQVVTNLHSNACDAMENHGGTVTISLKTVVVKGERIAKESEMPSGRYIRLTVADTGVGIPADIKDKIFEPYFTTKSIGRGTGLGLAIVHGIVNSSNGFIRIDSEEGKGATFHVFFPVAELEDVISSETLPPAEELVPTGTEHILYVDDEEDILEVSERILGRSGYKITAKTSSVEALETFRSDPTLFDLVITDQSMPRMSGLELASKIRDISPTTPILLYTGYTSDVTEQSAFEYGIQKVLIKPLRMNLLAMAVREVIDNNPHKASE